ncbi:esterase B1-like [Aphomia sociella]
MWQSLLLLIAVMSLSRQHEVHTAQGKLKGVSYDGYVSYNGIPYSRIDNPEGKFKIGGLAPTWSGVRESEQRPCSLYSRVEYCQQLDVHVPSKANYPWPVLVWVKGGSGQYHPGKLVRMDIIVVINRSTRFLSTNEETIPGNAGVKDVILALRWIRDNIVAFKGNPNKVVVAGQSFGAAMVEALTLSPMSHNLYHGVILQSGSILSPWAFNYDIFERALVLGKSISKNDNITTTLLNSDMETLVSKSDNLDAPYFPFGISMEKAFKNEERLLSEAPYELFARRGRSVPMMIGYNSDEAYVFVSMLKQRNVQKKTVTDLSFLLPDELNFVSEREVEHVVKEIQEMYFKDNVSMAAMLLYHRTPTPRHGKLPQWDAFNPSNPRIMDIGTELMMKEFPHKRSVKMWDDIYKKYYYSRNH